MKKIAINKVRAVKALLGWLVIGSVALAVIPPINSFIRREILPFGIEAPPLDGKEMVDPRTPITLEALGLGARLAKVEMRDETGKVLAEASDQSRVSLPSPLAFGTHHTVKVTAERPWFGQSLTRQISFTTVGVPKLEGPAHRMLGPDSSITLQFDRPVGDLQASGDLRLTAEPDAAHQTIKLVASDYAQDRTYPVQLNWHTSTGVPLPPLHLELTTAPPLSADVPIKGMTNLGLAMPLQLKFSEPLADRASAGRNIQVETVAGEPVAGKWQWQGQRLLQFTPQPSWPAASTIQVEIDQTGLKALRGGTLEKPFSVRFNTGSDRRIFVYLDKQKVVAMEDGQPVRTFNVSTGKGKTPTVTGSFYIYDRYLHKTMRSDVGRGQKGFYEVENVPYTQFFHKDYALHGAFWHNNFGHPASHGCVNMATREQNKRWPKVPEDAGWLYRWASLGVPVTVMRESPVEAKTLQVGNGRETVSEKISEKRESPASGESFVRLEPGMGRESAAHQ